MLHVRRYLIACVVLSVIGSLGEAVVASARTVAHKHKKHHKARPKPSVLPYMGRMPNPSIFGINTLGYDSNQGYFERNLPTAAQMGSQWVHFTNDSVHFSRTGQVNWSVLDSEVKAARKLGLGVLVSLGGSPASCSVLPRPSDFTGCPPTTKGDLYAYSLFLRSELLRYHNVVQYWESWLEPNNKAYWRPSVNPQQYAMLLEAQYEVFQQFNSRYHTNLKLLFGGPIGFSTMPADGWAVMPYVHAVLHDLHRTRAFDGIGLHAYRFPSSNTGPATLDWGPDASEYDYVGNMRYPGQGCDRTFSGFCQMTWSEEVSAYEQEFANDGYPDMPLWVTEFGWPGDATAVDALYPGFHTQAQYMQQAYNVLLHLPFVQAAFWFNLRDYQPNFVSPDPSFFYHYGMLQYSFGQKPAASVFEAFVHANPNR